MASDWASERVHGAFHMEITSISRPFEGSPRISHSR